MNKRENALIAFFVGPLIAWLNHRSIFGGQVSETDRPGLFTRIWSGAAVVILVLVSLFYLYLRITG